MASRCPCLPTVLFLEAITSADPEEYLFPRLRSQRELNNLNTSKQDDGRQQQTIYRTQQARCHGSNNNRCIAQPSNQDRSTPDG
jgi:hypothetical protein